MTDRDDTGQPDILRRNLFGGIALAMLMPQPLGAAQVAGRLAGLDAMALTELKPYVMLADDHPLAARHELSPADLADTPMIVLGQPPSSEYFTGIFEDAGIVPKVAFRSSNFEMVRGLVGQGLGFALAATRPAGSVSYDGSLLVTRPLKAETRPSRVMLARRRGAKLTRQAERFIWFCRDFFDLHH